MDRQGSLSDDKQDELEEKYEVTVISREQTNLKKQITDLQDTLNSKKTEMKRVEMMMSKKGNAVGHLPEILLDPKKKF